MDIDLELYRQEVRISNDPLIRLSAIDIAPEHPQRTLVFIHGFGGQASQWQNQLKKFSFNNRVIALDLRGHGLSDAPASQYTMAETQADLEAALELLNVPEKFILVGHSYGGSIVTEYAVNHPERVERLILIGTAGEIHLAPYYRFLLALPYSVLRAFGPFVRNWVQAPPTVMKSFYMNNLLNWKGWDLFRQLTMPTLVIRGNRDRVFRKAVFEEVARSIPASEEVNVGASGHMVMLERRQAVNRAIERFLEASPRSWREASTETGTAARAGLIESRPWLSHYEENVPYTIPLPNIPFHQLLRSAVRRFPLRTALNFEGKRMTYRRLNQEVNRFANALRSLGCDKGDRVMLLMPNLPQLVIGYLGAIKAGAVAVFSRPLTEPDELLRQIDDSGAGILVTINQYGELARRAMLETSVNQVIFTNVSDYLPFSKQVALFFSPKKRKEFSLQIELQDDMRRFNRILYSHSRKSPQVQVGPNDLAVIQYTGGTTAEPKGVMLTHRNLIANTLQTRQWIADAQEGQERFLCVLPFSHSYGLMTALNVPISLGAAMIIKAGFETEEVLHTIKRTKPTLFPGVPNMYVAINNFPGVRKYGISSIRACISGAAPLPVEVQEAFEKLTKGRLVEGYGLTEATTVTHANPLHGLRKIGTIGIPLPSTEAKVVNLKRPGEEMPSGQIGELAVRGPQIMRGYWGDQEATQKAITSDGWLLTGDVAQSDPDGYFRIIARKADMWYPAKPGEPAFPRDVEEVLYEIPQVKEAAVVAIAGQPIAFVIAGQERPTAESLLAFCKRRLPPELVPLLVIFLDDFPRTFIGKVLRRELAKRYEQQHTQ